MDLEKSIAMAFTRMCKGACADDDGEDEGPGLTDAGLAAQGQLDDTYDAALELASNHAFKKILSQDPIGKRYARYIEANEERRKAWEARDARQRKADRAKWAADEYESYKEPLGERGKGVAETC